MMNTGDFTDTELGMIAKGLVTEAKSLRRSAAGRKNAGEHNAERRAHLRGLAKRYEALAAEVEQSLT
jgi:hypothetical protein